MSTVQEIAFSFSFSVKRQHQFRETLKETLESQEQIGRRAKVRQLGETRWVLELTLCVLLNYHLT